MGVSRGVQPTNWQGSLNKKELAILCLEEFCCEETLVGLVPASFAYTLGYACLVVAKLDNREPPYPLEKTSRH